MTKLLVEELITILFQEYHYYRNDRCRVAVFAPYLYVQNAPAGTFTFSVTKGTDTIFSQSFTSQDVLDSIESAHDHCHVFFPIIPETPILMENGSYQLKLTASGYRPVSGTNMIGWIRQHEDVFNEIGITVEDDTDHPLAVKFYKYRGHI